MEQFSKNYINGDWTETASNHVATLVDPVTESVTGSVSLASRVDIEEAVQAARVAFPSYSRASCSDRLELLQAIQSNFEARFADVASCVAADIGAPLWLCEQAQAATGLAHIQSTIAVLEQLEDSVVGPSTKLQHVPVGVCALITPWNWPVNQIMCKVAPALASGCTIVLKPSELAPRTARIIAEIVHASGVPGGVFNMIFGDGSAGAVLSAHSDIDMVSFTGSTKAGIEVARAAAPTVKRVCQELGGKSANIILDDADFETAVAEGFRAVCLNSGQTCSAPTRMLVPHDKMEEAAAVVRRVAADITYSPGARDGLVGPVVARQHWNNINDLIRAAISDGAKLATGGPGRPEGIESGYYVKPTAFTHVRNDMLIARQEVFGPVLAIIGYADDDDAIRIANDNPYGLAAYVHSADAARAMNVASQLRAGQVMINSTALDKLDFAAPFGGFGQSGNGREWGAAGLDEFFEKRAIINCPEPQTA